MDFCFCFVYSDNKIVHTTNTISTKARIRTATEGDKNKTFHGSCLSILNARESTEVPIFKLPCLAEISKKQSIAVIGHHQESPALNQAGDSQSNSSAVISMRGAITWFTGDQWTLIQQLKAAIDLPSSPVLREDRELASPTANGCWDHNLRNVENGQSPVQNREPCGPTAEVSPLLWLLLLPLICWSPHQSFNVINYHPEHGGNETTQKRVNFK